MQEDEFLHLDFLCPRCSAPYGYGPANYHWFPDTTTRCAECDIPIKYRCFGFEANSFSQISFHYVAIAFLKDDHIQVDVVRLDDK